MWPCALSAAVIAEPPFTPPARATASLETTHAGIAELVISPVMFDDDALRADGVMESLRDCAADWAVFFGCNTATLAEAAVVP